MLETHISQVSYVQQILDLITNIAEKLTIDFAPYIPLIQKTMRRNKLNFERFDFQVEQITKLNPISLFQKNMEISAMEEQQLQLAANLSPGMSTSIVSGNLNAGHNSQAPRRSMMEISEMRKKYVNFEQLLKEFDTSKCSIEADWVEWLKKTSH